MVDHSGQSGLGPDVGGLCYRQIEHHRMPMMAYLALDGPRALSRNNFVRLGLVTGAASAGDALPFADQHVADFEARQCCDRFWTSARAAPDTRCLCSGYALLVVGRTDASFYRCAESGVLAQFRHPRPDLPHRAFPKGRAVDAQRPAGRGVKGFERPPAVQRQAFQTQHPQQL